MSDEIKAAGSIRALDVAGAVDLFADTRLAGIFNIANAIYRRLQAFLGAQRDIAGTFDARFRTSGGKLHCIDIAGAFNFRAELRTLAAGGDVAGIDNLQRQPCRFDAGQHDIAAATGQHVDFVATEAADRHIAAG